jgi:outer membrane lipoprotein-sorting protein
MTLIAALAVFLQQGPDPGVLDAAKEQAAILADAKSKAGKALSYQAKYTMTESDSAKDVSIGSEGTITLRLTPADPKKKIGATWQIAIDDQGQMGQEATKFLAVFAPKKYLTLRPASKEGEEVDPSKEKKLQYWPFLAATLGDLMKECDVKLVRMSSRYVLQRTQKSSQGGETNPDDENKVKLKPSFDPTTSHIFSATPKGAAAAQCKKITLHIDMDAFFVTRIEFDWKGDGLLKSAFALKEVDLAAKIEDAAFAPDTTGYKITKK